MNRNALLPIGLVLAAFLVVGGFIAFKNYAVKKTPVPEIVVADNVPEQEVVEEVVEEEPPPEPPKQTTQKSKPVVVEEINDMNPMMGGELPTREEAIQAAQEILTRYREASPEERQQIVMGVTMMQGIINGLSMNAGALLQQMPEEERERVANLAAGSQDLLDAVQEEMFYEVSDEEAQVFGGLFQSFRNASQAFSGAPMYYQQQY